MSEPPIHATAARGFERGGAEYERGRPGYPEEAIELLAHELGIGPGKTIVDIAAGTGKLTRALTAFGARVLAVEPIEAMRAQLVQAVPEVEVIEGTAEALRLTDGSVDAITVGQAMHWFDTRAAAAEFKRVLKPGGGLGVLSNGWDLRVPWVSRMQEVVHSYAGDTPRHDTSPWRDLLTETGFFDQLHEHAFPNAIVADITTLLFRVSSVSYISALGDDERAHVLRQVHDIAASDIQRRGGGTELMMPYTCKVWWCHSAISGARR